MEERRNDRIDEERNEADRDLPEVEAAASDDEVPFHVPRD